MGELVYSLSAINVQASDEHWSLRINLYQHENSRNASDP